LLQNKVGESKHDAIFVIRSSDQTQLFFCDKFPKYSQLYLHSSLSLLFETLSMEHLFLKAISTVLLLNKSLSGTYKEFYNLLYLLVPIWKFIARLPDHEENISFATGESYKSY